MYSSPVLNSLTPASLDMPFVLFPSPCSESEQEEYELLCPDGSTAPMTAYAACNLGRGPGRAIVTRHNFKKIAKKFLTVIQVFLRQHKEGYSRAHARGLIDTESY